MVAMRVLPRRSPYRPCAAEAPAQARAANIKAIPAQVGVKSNRFISRFGMYASPAKNAPATIPRMSTTLGSPRRASKVPRGSSGRAATPITTMAPIATNQPSRRSSKSAVRPTVTAPAATTTASPSRRQTAEPPPPSPPPRSTPRRRSAIVANARAVSTATPRNAHRQCRNSATAPARNGPIIDGTTHAAAKAAKTRPCRFGGYSLATTTYSATV